MTTLHSFIKEQTPKFNKSVVEGLSYTRMKHGLQYIDKFIYYICNNKNSRSNNLRYLGYEVVTPEEEVKMNLRSSKAFHDVSKNTMYLVKFKFQYGNEQQIREYPVYLPYILKGNRFLLAGSNFLVMPVFSDKVISVGEQGIFIDILTAKRNFSKFYRTFKYKGVYKHIPLITTLLYIKNDTKLDPTTRAKITVMHYLLAEYGYSETMRLVLGYVPKPVYDTKETNVLTTTGLVPKGWLKHKDLYEPTKIKFIINEDENEEHALYCVGNVMYIIEEFADRITINDLDNPLVWRRLLSEAILSGAYSISYLHEKITAHFNELNSNLNVTIVEKLKAVGIEVSTFMELMMKIFINYNNWIMAKSSKSYFYNKTYEVETRLFAYITNEFTKVVLDINKEEIRANHKLLDPLMVDKSFSKYIKMRKIFSLKNENVFITSVEYAGDHLYPKNSRMVAQQEANAINKKKKSNNTTSKHKISAESAVIGSILGLSKSNPIPNIHINPYVRLDPVTGTVLPHEGYEDIIERTNILLSNISLDGDVEDISDMEPGDTESDDSSYDDYDDDDQDSIEEDDN